VDSPVRAALSACLLSSGLILAAGGGASAVADPHSNHGSTDDHSSSGTGEPVRPSVVPIGAGLPPAPPLAARAPAKGVGEVRFLHSGGLAEVAALAVPGLTAMIVLTGAGSVIGYRQAKSGHVIRSVGTARFVK
jgi:hypothetical protein